MNAKTKKTITIINTIIVCLMLVIGAGLKIFRVPAIVEDFNTLGVGRYTQFLGLLELIFLGLLLIPKTMKLGFLLFCGYLGGAIATHLSHNDPFFQPVIPLFFICLNVFLRDKTAFYASSGQFMN
jgi:hypothetical protein